MSFVSGHGSALVQQRAGTDVIVCCLDRIPSSVARWHAFFAVAGIVSLGALVLMEIGALTYLAMSWSRRCPASASLARAVLQTRSHSARSCSGLAGGSVPSTAISLA